MKTTQSLFWGQGSVLTVIWSEQLNLLNKDSYVVLISDRSGRCLGDDLSSSHICKTNIIYGDTLCSG